MAYIPLFTSWTKEELTEQFDLTLHPGHEIIIYIPKEDLSGIDPSLMTKGIPSRDMMVFTGKQYRADRHDGPDGKATLSAYMYLDEETGQLIAIDDTVRNSYKRHIRYNIKETPFQEIIDLDKTTP